MADPGGFGARWRRRPTSRVDMGRARQKLQIVEAIATRRQIPGDVAGRLVDEERLMVGVLELEIAGAQGEAPAHRLDRRIGAELGLEPQRDRHIGFERRLVGVEQPQVVETEIARGQRHRPLRAAARLGFNGPAPLRPLRPDRDRRRLARPHERQLEIVVDGALGQRFVENFEVAVDEADAVERLAGPGHRVDQSDRDQSEIRSRRRTRRRAEAAPASRSSQRRGRRRQRSTARRRAAPAV